MQESPSKIKTLGLFEIRPYLKLLKSNLLEFVCQVQKDHGDLTHLKIPFFNLMVVSDPEWVQLLMTSLHSHLQKPDFLKKTAQSYGATGPFIDNGKKWKEGRDFFSTLFHKKTFDHYMGIREAIVFKIDKMILENPKQRPVHFFSSLTTKNRFSTPTSKKKFTVFEPFSRFSESPSQKTHNILLVSLRFR